MKTSLLHLAERLKASAWTLPCVCSVLGICLSQVALWADQRVGVEDLRWLGFMEGATPDGARLLLSTIATSMLAIAGMSFSSIIVALTLASQQFGPRLLRNFIRDSLGQTVLGSLIGTFVYCLLVIRGVRGAAEFLSVPHLSVIVAVVLSLFSLGLFIAFIHHIVSMMQAERVVGDAFRLLEDSVELMACEGDGSRGAEDQNDPLERPGGGIAVSSATTGYVQAVNHERLLEISCEEDLELVIECRAGHFVSCYQPVARVLGLGEDRCIDESIEKRIRESFFIGSVRTPEQDHEHGFLQLVEVGLRALSPGINDPFTAMNCIDFVGAGLQRVFQCKLPPAVHRDSEGAVRIHSWPIEDKDVIDAALDQLRRAGVGRVDVSCRLLEMLGVTVLQAGRQAQREALATHAGLIHEEASAKIKNAHDQGAIDERYRRFVDALETSKSHA